MPDVSKMSGKEIYDETKRLKAEREYRRELERQSFQDKHDEKLDRDEQIELLLERFVKAFETIAERLPVQPTR